MNENYINELKVLVIEFENNIVETQRKIDALKRNIPIIETIIENIKRNERRIMDIKDEIKRSNKNKEYITIAIQEMKSLEEDNQRLQDELLIMHNKRFN